MSRSWSPRWFCTLSSLNWINKETNMFNLKRKNYSFPQNHIYGTLKNIDTAWSMKLVNETLKHKQNYKLHGYILLSTKYHYHCPQNRIHLNFFHYWNFRCHDPKTKTTILKCKLDAKFCWLQGRESAPSIDKLPTNICSCL